MLYARALERTTSLKQISDTKIFPAPTRGWIQNEAYAKPKTGGAEVLINMFPTTRGVRMRKGLVKHATIDEAATHLAVYDAGGLSKLFACDGTSIYDVTTPADPDTAPTAAVTDQTSGDYCSLQVATSGGEFLLFFNGADKHLVYDGSTFEQDDPAITGVDSADVSQAWKWKSFVWLIEKGTMDAWYLPTGAIGGAATVFPLGGVFRNGGSLLFGATWSQDSGDGLDDYCLFVTTEGEIAVYQGDNPASASGFALVGVYRVGKPLHKNAWFRSGGDVFVMTDDGIVPLSSAVSMDRTGLFMASITFPIEEAWRQVVLERGGSQIPFNCTLWHSETMLVLGIPTYDSFDACAFVMNSRTGAWCKYSGWNVRCAAVYNDRFFFGTPEGAIVEGEVSGSDLGSNYQGVLIPLMDTFGNAVEKNAIAARVVAKTNLEFTPQLFACSDYEAVIPTPINADGDDAGNLWDVAVWDESTWGGGGSSKQMTSQWQDVAAIGHALAPGLQVNTGRVSAPDLEIISLMLQYEQGQVFADG